VLLRFNLRLSEAVVVVIVWLLDL